MNLGKGAYDQTRVPHPHAHVCSGVMLQSTRVEMLKVVSESHVRNSDCGESALRSSRPEGEAYWLECMLTSVVNSLHRKM